MLSLLKAWKGAVEINCVRYENISKIPEIKLSGDVYIHLISESQGTSENVSKPSVATSDNKTYRITVKKYMTEKASPEFDFMAKWNNDNPMPLRTMTGTIIQETRGMVKMSLHGDIWAERICTCMCCGRKLTNPVSQYFGIGPECGNHSYVNPFDSDEELKEAVAEYKKKLQAITWEGWVIRSAITEQIEL